MLRTDAYHSLFICDSGSDSEEVHPRRRNRSRSPCRSPRRQEKEECDCHPRRECDGVQCVERRERLLDQEMVVRITSFKLGLNSEMMKSTDLEEKTSVQPNLEPEIEPEIEQSTISRCICEGSGSCGGQKFSGATWGHATGGVFNCPSLMREYVNGL